jgi:hypothetical protein
VKDFDGDRLASAFASIYLGKRTLPNFLLEHDVVWSYLDDL